MQIKKRLLILHLSEKNDVISGHLALRVSKTWLQNSPVIAKYVPPNGFLFYLYVIHLHEIKM